MRKNVTENGLLRRSKSFDFWLRTRGDDIGFYLLQANKQAYIRGMLRRAFNAGSNYEARMSVRYDKNMDKAT